MSNEMTKFKTQVIFLNLFPSKFKRKKLRDPGHQAAHNKVYKKNLSRHKTFTTALNVTKYDYLDCQPIREENLLHM